MKGSHRGRTIALPKAIGRASRQGREPEPGDGDGSRAGDE